MAGEAKSADSVLETISVAQEEDSHMFFRKACIYSAVTECFNELTNMEKVLVSEFIDSIKRNQPQAYKQPDIELLAGVIVDDLVYRKLLPFLQLNFRGRQLQMKANLQLPDHDRNKEVPREAHALMKKYGMEA